MTNTLHTDQWDVEHIIEAVFAHGKLTPHDWHDIPEGQLTVVEAIDRINLIISWARKEAEKKGYERGVEEKAGKEEHSTDKWEEEFDETFPWLPDREPPVYVVEGLDREAAQKAMDDLSKGGVISSLPSIKLLENPATREELKSFIEKVLSQAREEEREQKYYELSMFSQVIDFFLSKDAEEYGETPLHGKLRAFLAKEEARSLKQPRGEEGK